MLKLDKYLYFREDAPSSAIKQTAVAFLPPDMGITGGATKRNNGTLVPTLSTLSEIEQQARIKILRVLRVR